MLLSACGPQQDGAQPCGSETGDDREFILDFVAQLVNPLTHDSIDFLEFSLHHPKCPAVGAVELFDFSRKPLTDAWIGIVLVALPALEHGLAHTIKTRSIALEIAPKCPIQEPLESSREIAPCRKLNLYCPWVSARSMSVNRRP